MASLQLTSTPTNSNAKNCGLCAANELLITPMSILRVSWCCRYHSGQLFVIDVAQAVEHDHPHALEFLRKDCVNISGM